MKPLRSVILLSLVAIAVAACARDFDSPESAVRALESAYAKNDIEAAVAAKDFVEEARLMLQMMNPRLSTDEAIIGETASVLELSFRQEIATNGFPDFTNLKCGFTAKEELSADLVKLTEECVSPDGRKSVEELAVARSNNGWHVVVIQN